MVKSFCELSPLFLHHPMNDSHFESKTIPKKTLVVTYKMDFSYLENLKNQTSFSMIVFFFFAPCEELRIT